MGEQLTRGMEAEASTTSQKNAAALWALLQTEKTSRVSMWLWDGGCGVRKRGPGI
jgi:hypothetical protein